MISHLGWGGGGLNIRVRCEDHYTKSHKKCEKMSEGLELSIKCVRLYLNSPSHVC